MFPHSKTFELVAELLESTESERPVHLFDNFDATAQQENLDDAEECMPIDQTELPDVEGTSTNTKNRSGECKYKPILVDEEDTLFLSID